MGGRDGEKILALGPAVSWRLAAAQACCCFALALIALAITAPIFRGKLWMIFVSNCPSLNLRFRMSRLLSKWLTI